MFLEKRFYLQAARGQSTYRLPKGKVLTGCPRAKYLQAARGQSTYRLPKGKVLTGCPRAKYLQAAQGQSTYRLPKGKVLTGCPRALLIFITFLSIAMTTGKVVVRKFERARTVSFNKERCRCWNLQKLCPLRSCCMIFFDQNFWLALKVKLS